MICEEFCVLTSKLFCAILWFARVGQCIWVDVCFPICWWDEILGPQGGFHCHHCRFRVPLSNSPSMSLYVCTGLLPKGDFKKKVLFDSSLCIIVTWFQPHGLLRYVESCWYFQWCWSYVPIFPHIFPYVSPSPDVIPDPGPRRSPASSWIAVQTLPWWPLWPRRSRRR